MLQSTKGGDATGEKNPTSGRKFDQKMKPYLVMQYLIQNTDESHVITATDLADKLEEKYDIDAERRSIYSDIHAINKAFIMLENGVDTDEAEEMLEGDTDDEEKLIVYKPNRWFYAINRNYDVNDKMF